MTIFRAELDFKCIAKERGRSLRAGKTYMRPSYMLAKADLAWQVHALTPPFIAKPTAVHLYLLIGYRLKGRPDDDNALGFVMDALQGVCYDDDAQVTAHALHRNRAIVQRHSGSDRIIIVYRADGSMLTDEELSREEVT